MNNGVNSNNQSAEANTQKKEKNMPKDKNFLRLTILPDPSQPQQPSTQNVNSNNGQQQAPQQVEQPAAMPAKQPEPSGTSGGGGGGGRPRPPPIDVSKIDLNGGTPDAKPQAAKDQTAAAAAAAAGPVTANATTNATSTNTNRSENQLTSQSVRRTTEQLKEMIDKMDITNEQKDKLADFLKLRDNIGELANDDLSVEGELGSGNGGVVLKVRHRRLGIVMAKKVRTFNIVCLISVRLVGLSSTLRLKIF